MDNTADSLGINWIPIGPCFTSESVGTGGYNRLALMDASVWDYWRIDYAVVTISYNSILDGNTSAELCWGPYDPTSGDDLFPFLSCAAYAQPGWSTTEFENKVESYTQQPIYLSSLPGGSSIYLRSESGGTSASLAYGFCSLSAGRAPGS